MRAWAALVVAGTAPLLSLASASSAQDDRARAVIPTGRPALHRLTSVGDRVPVFRGPVVASRVEEQVDPPPALDQGQVSAILHALGQPPEPGSLYARVTPSQPSVPGKGALVFVDANLVEGGEGFAEFKNVTEPVPLTGYAVLWLYSPAGRSYLIDCGVKGMYWNLQTQQGPVFTISGPGNTVQAFDYRATFSQAGYHLVFSLVADQAGWYPFAISTQPAGEELYTTWKLFGCEAKNL